MLAKVLFYFAQIAMFYIFFRNGVVGVGILVIGVTIILIFYPRESGESSEETSKQVNHIFELPFIYYSGQSNYG